MPVANGQADVGSPEAYFDLVATFFSM